MAKQLKLDRNTSNVRAGVLTKDMKNRLKHLAAILSSSSEYTITMSDILRELVIDFVEGIEYANSVNDIAIKYIGKDLYTTKDTTTVTFRIENDEYKKFCHYSLCIGNDPTELLRKLVAERLGLKISSYSLDNIFDI